MDILKTILASLYNFFIMLNDLLINRKLPTFSRNWSFYIGPPEEMLMEFGNYTLISLFFFTIALAIYMQETLLKKDRSALYLLFQVFTATNIFIIYNYLLNVWALQLTYEMQHLFFFPFTPAEDRIFAYFLFFVWLTVVIFISTWLMEYIVDSSESIRILIVLYMATLATLTLLNLCFYPLEDILNGIEIYTYIIMIYIIQLFIVRWSQ